VSIAICAVCIFSAASYAQTAPVGITPGRAQALVAVAVGLISLIVGGLAWGRSPGRIGKGSGRGWAIAGGGRGLVGMVLRVVHLATSTGGFGTGGGRAGAVVALVLSLIGISLGGLVLARSRRSRGIEKTGKFEQVL